MFKFLLTLFVLITLSSGAEYPKSFAKLAVPLYESAKAFKEYEDIATLHDAIVAYEQSVHKIIPLGYLADSSLAKKDMKTYLKQLRKLQKKYDKLLYLLHKSIDNAIKADDYNKFLRLTAYAFDGLFVNSNFRNRAIAFYTKHKHKSNCAVLDKYIGDTKLINDTLELFKAEVINSTYDSNSKKVSKKRVQIITNRVKNTIHVKLKNKNIYPVTVWIKGYFNNIKQVKKVQGETLVLQPKSTLDLATLTIENGDAYYRYRFSWVMGSKDAKHDDSYIYSLPYKKGSSHVVSQGYNGTQTHKGRSAYAIDFPMPVGTKIYAAREGIVVKTKSNSNEGGYAKKYASSGNYVRVLHSDGTMATYYHLKHRGVLVHVGDKVSKGFPLGYSGNTGYTSGPHLHFSIFRVTDKLKNQTVPVKIDSQEGVIEEPIIGHYYTAK